MASTMTTAMTEDKSDPTFRKWSEISDKLGDIYLKAQKGVSQYCGCKSYPTGVSE